MGEQDVTRRSFMVRVIIGIIVFIGAVLAAALGGFAIIPALRKKGSEWTDAGTISDLDVDQPQERRFSEMAKSGWLSEKMERSIWLVKKADNRVVAYSPNCPHLGCGYRWFAADQKFKCPCHGSVFDINGKVLAGPAPRPLDTLTTKVEDGRVFVRYETFQLGVGAKVAA